MSDETTAYEGWAVLELMGHRRLAGYVREVVQYGTPMCRLDVPVEGGEPITQFYPGTSIYCLSPVTEDVARAVALRNKPAPVSPYEVLPPSLPAGRSVFGGPSSDFINPADVGGAGRDDDGDWS